MLLLKLLKVQNFFTLLVFLLSAYLLVAAAWTWVAVEPLAKIALKSPYEPLNEEQKFRLLKVVDPAFPNHSGINFTPGQGTETVASQVSHIVLFEGPDIPGFSGYIQAAYKRVDDCCRRFDPARFVRALVVNSQLSKEEQVQILVSNVYMGLFQEQTVFGLPSAALVYFNARIADLNEQQWLALVAMIENPDTYNPLTTSEALNDRVQRISRMITGSCVAKSYLDVTYSACDYDESVSHSDQY